MVEVEHLMAMSDNTGNLIDEMVRWKYYAAEIMWPIRNELVVIGVQGSIYETGEPGSGTYGQWFEKVFYESLEDYRERAEREKIGEKFAEKA